ncbi:MAG TPA: hypothetical protein PK573_12025 [Spirochaetota bacterium]|nr:hypothetical protein [Spirochaetota bacterium]HRZ26619.1 hypothetical protein [Spirochaetota bacterium]
MENRSDQNDKTSSKKTLRYGRDQWSRNKQYSGGQMTPEAQMTKRAQMTGDNKNNNSEE